MNTQNNESTHVRVELQFVRNRGNYVSIRVSSGVEDFVRKGETVDAATDRVYSFVENKVIEKVSDIEKELKDG